MYVAHITCGIYAGVCEGMRQLSSRPLVSTQLPLAAKAFKRLE